MSVLGRKAKYSEDDILIAAEKVVATLGAQAMSFDAVAKEAGVSKGAVLHYFATKQLLIERMVERLVNRLNPVHPLPLRDAETYIERMEFSVGSEDATASALLAAVVQDLKVLTPLKVANRKAIDALSETHLGSHRAKLLHYALDGLWLSEILGISPLTVSEREEFFKTLKEDMRNSNP